MRLRHEKRDLFYWMDRLFPWFFGGVALLIVAYWVAIAVIAWFAIGAAVDAGPTGIAESLGSLWRAFQRGAGE